MTADAIKALIERLQKYSGTLAPPIARGLTHEAQRALTDLSKQVETLSLENQRLRLEFRADCEKQAEELFAVQRDAERYRWLRNLTRGQQTFGGVSTGSSPSMQWFKFPPISPASNIMRGAVSQHLDEAIDAARSQSEEEKP